MSTLLLELSNLYDFCEQRLNSDGEIVGYILPERYNRKLLHLVNKIKASNDEEAKDALISAPVYTKEQWGLFECLSRMSTSRVLDEEWVTPSVGEKHFNYHCLGGGEYTSKEDDIYYDFTTKEDFDKYEAEVYNKAMNPDITVDSLAEPDFVDNLVNNLKSGKTVFLSELCGLKGKTGTVKYAYVPFATEHTTNYSDSAPTVNFMVLTPDNKTISLFPILLSYLPTRLGRVINRNHTDTPINVQRLNAYNDMKEKLKNIHFDDIVKNQMRTSKEDSYGTLLFPNRFFSVYSYAYPYVRKGEEEPVTSVSFTIRSRDIKREVRTPYYYSYDEEQFRKNVDTALELIKKQMEEQNRIGKEENQS